MTGGKLKIKIRRQQILRQLNRTGKVSVNELSAALQVTPATIRNDLTELEQQGLLLRVQGGAVPLPAAEASAGVAESAPNALQKQSIGAAVAGLVRDGDTLFINSGTTCEHIAAALRARKGLNVVTNALKVALELGSVPSFRVLLVGGEINAQYGFTHGGDAQEQLEKYRADWAILSVDGISHTGVTTHHAEEAIIDRVMAAGAKQILVAADGSKIGRVGFSRVCASGPELTLVTDSGCDPDALAQLEQQGVRTLLVQVPASAEFD